MAAANLVVIKSATRKDACRGLPLHEKAILQHPALLSRNRSPLVTLLPQPPTFNQELCFYPAENLSEVAQRISKEARKRSDVDIDVLFEEAASKICKPTANLRLHACNKSPLMYVRLKQLFRELQMLT